MHMQPIYRMNGFIGREGTGISGGVIDTYGNPFDVGMDIFHRGLCLPSDNKMTPEQQEEVVAVMKACYE